MINAYYYIGSHCKERNDFYQLGTVKTGTLANMNSSLLTDNNEIIEEDRHIILLKWFYQIYFIKENCTGSQNYLLCLCGQGFQVLCAWRGGNNGDSFQLGLLIWGLLHKRMRLFVPRKYPLFCKVWHSDGGMPTVSRELCSYGFKHCTDESLQC